MIQIDFPPSIPKELLIGPQPSIDLTLQRTEKFFRAEGFVGGIAREYVLADREVWIALLPAFNPFLIRQLRPVLRIAAEHYGYLRARTEVLNSKASRFAFALGFMWEETTYGYNFFSVRA